jgi:hypothetical protein
VRVRREAQVSHSEDASVKGKQVAPVHPSSDLPVSEPGSPELRARGDPILTARDLGDSSTPTVARFLLSTSTNVARVGHARQRGSESVTGG